MLALNLQNILYTDMMLVIVLVAITFSVTPGRVMIVVSVTTVVIDGNDNVYLVKVEAVLNMVSLDSIIVDNEVKVVNCSTVVVERPFVGQVQLSGTV